MNRHTFAWASCAFGILFLVIVGSWIAHEQDVFTLGQLSVAAPIALIVGVCGGLATYSGIDANIIRIIVAVVTILGAGSLALLYLVAWVLVPREESTPGVFGDQSGPTG